MPGSSPNPYTRRALRLIHLRRAVAVVLVLGAAAVVAVFLLQRRHQVAPQAPVLGIQVQQSASGLDISKSVAGRPVFRVFAAHAEKLRPGGLDELRQVRILVYDQAGRRADEISGDSFRYDEATGMLQADGAVHVQLQNNLILTARGLRYNVKQGTGVVTQGVAFRMGAAQGSAGALQLDSHASTAQFSGGVHLEWPRPGQATLSLQSDQARIERASAAPQALYRVHLDGAARLRQGTASLAADQLVAWVTPQYVLRRLQASGHVQALAAGTDPLRVQAASAQAVFTPSTQKLQTLRLSGHVTAEQTRQEAGQTLIRRLRAEDVAMTFAPPNALHLLQARGGAELTESGAGEPASLSAPGLDFHFAPPSSATQRQPQLVAVVSQGRTDLQRGPLQAQADQLQLTLGPNQQPRSALASGHVLARQRVAGGERTSRSDRLEVSFAASSARTPQIRQVVQTGHVVLNDAGRVLSAQRLVYTPASDTALLTGGVHGSDADTDFSAGTASWIRHPDGSSTLLAEAAPHSRLAISLLAHSASPTRDALTLAPMLAPGQPIVVTAHSLRWDQPPGAAPSTPTAFRGTAVFTGDVRLLQAPNAVRADRLSVVSGDAGPSLGASGDVRTDFVGSNSAVHSSVPLPPSARGSRAVAIAAESLTYSALQHQVVYAGDVRLNADGALLTAPHLIVTLNPAAGSPGLQRALASGGVTVTQTTRTAHADRLSFDFADQLIRLEGGPPSISDAEHGRISGDPLTFSLASDEIQVGGKLGTRVSGHTNGRN